MPGVVSSSEPIFSTPILDGQKLTHHSGKSVFTTLELSFWFSLLFSGPKVPKVHSFSLLTIMCFVFVLSSMKMFILSFSMTVPLILTFVFSLSLLCVWRTHIPEIWTHRTILTGNLFHSRLYEIISLIHSSVLCVFLLLKGKILFRCFRDLSSLIHYWIFSCQILVNEKWNEWMSRHSVLAPFPSFPVIQACLAFCSECFV